MSDNFWSKVNKTEGCWSLLHGKFSLGALSKIFGVGKSQVHRIVTNQQWV